MLALAIGGLLSSAVFAENIFSRPGIGKLIVDSADVHNYPVVQGAVLTTVAFFAFASPSQISSWPGSIPVSAQVSEPIAAIELIPEAPGFAVTVFRRLRSDPWG